MSLSNLKFEKIANPSAFCLVYSPSGIGHKTILCVLFQLKWLKVSECDSFESQEVTKKKKKESISFIKFLMSR
jgi:hypothetical protein